MSRRDAMRYAFALLGSRFCIIMAAGGAVFVLLLLRVISADQGMPILAMLAAGAGFQALGTSPPPSSDTHGLEPVPNQQIRATLDPREPEPPPERRRG